MDSQAGRLLQWRSLFEGNNLHLSVSSKLKRTIDIVGGAIGLAFALLIFVPIALAIVIDSPGPVFFTQTRCGLRGKPFKLWKFRSMVANASDLKQTVANEAEGFIFKNENDPRITRVGRFLRQTSLDEFPQFWNVVRGDMSLVGTRPPTPDEVSQYSPRHWRRLEVKPGITGLWQVSGRSSVIDFEDIVSLDLKYQEHWSVRFDLRIVVKTIWVVLMRKGAC